MADNPLKPKAGPVTGRKDDAPGQLAEDDRGNVTWQWKDDEDLQADDEIGHSQRVKALADPGLELVEDTKPEDLTRSSNPVGLKAGYNPYESGELNKSEWKQKKDLRKLSEWISAKKRADRIKREGDTEK